MRPGFGILLIALMALAACGGCVSRPPTIAHVHIGHALTGVHVTPNHEGYFVQAEERAPHLGRAGLSDRVADDPEDARRAGGQAVAAQTSSAASAYARS